MRELQRFQVALKAFIVDGDRVLMVRESSGEGVWELPTAVLRRELAEELGAAFTYSVEDPVVAWTRPPDPPRRNMSVFLVGYRCQRGPGEIVLSDEHVESRWVTRAESAHLPLAPGYAAALEQFWLSMAGVEEKPA